MKPFPAAILTTTALCVPLLAAPVVPTEDRCLVDSGDALSQSSLVVCTIRDSQLAKRYTPFVLNPNGRKHASHATLDLFSNHLGSVVAYTVNPVSRRARRSACRLLRLFRGWDSPCEDSDDLPDSRHFEPFG